MENVIMENAYMTYEGKIRVDGEIILLSLWNSYLETEGENRIYLNDKDFFVKNFKNQYDAAMAVSLSNKWSWTDSFVYFNREGYLVSFSRWDDDNNPINMDKIDVDFLIRALQDVQSKQSKQKNRYDNNISRAIHDALE